MLVGDASLRKAQGMQKQICHRCLPNVQQNPFGGAPCTGDDTAAFPNKPCPGGIRTTVTFPTYVPLKTTVNKRSTTDPCLVTSY
jgi:hypothetical protein